MENLKRIREPLAWVLVVLSGLSLVLLIVQLSMYLLDSEVFFGWVLGLQTVDYGLMIALVAAVWACALAPAPPRARTIALVAAWVVTVTVALPWVLAVVSLLLTPTGWADWMSGWPPWQLVSLLYPVVNTGFGAVAAIALWALARRPPEMADEEADGEPVAELEVSDEAEENPTVWKPGEATGTVWRTADEAAAGTPGSTSLDAPDAAPDSTRRTAPSARPEQESKEDWRPPPSL